MDQNLENEVVELETPKKKNVCGIIALVLGIVSLVSFCTLGPVLGLIGIILAIVALAARKEPKKGLAIGGLITSIISFITGIVLIIAVVIVLNTVKTTLLESGMTEEQIAIVTELLSPTEIAEYTELYNDYMNGTLKEEDFSLEKLGLENRTFTAEEKDALKALARSLGVDENTIDKAESQLK